MSTEVDGRTTRSGGESRRADQENEDLVLESTHHLNERKKSDVSSTPMTILQNNTARRNAEKHGSAQTFGARTVH